MPDKITGIYSELPDPLLPELIESEGLPARFAGKIKHYFKVESTNDEARRAAEAGAPEGTVFLAETQTRGRGKLGRSWYSKWGEGIYSTLLLRPAIKPAQASLITLLSAIAVAESLRRILAPLCAERMEIDLKWPNDVLLNGKKLCGILCEMSLGAAGIQFVLVGIGINVAQRRFPPDLDKTATSLYLETGTLFPRPKLLATMLERFDSWYQRLLEGDSSSIVAQWSRLSSYAAGREVIVDKGGTAVRGRTAGLSAAGALRLVLPDGSMEEVFSGEIL